MTRTFERVCVGIDGSAHADVALRWAAQFAARHGSRVEPIYSWDYPTMSLLPSPIGWGVPPEETMQGVAEQAAADALVGLESDAGLDVTIDAPLVVRGAPGPVLVERAADAALLVVGSRGMGAVHGMIIGSVSSHCAAHAECPVAIVPEDTVVRRIERLVVGHDGSERSDTALRWVIDAYPGSAIEVVHVWNMQLMPAAEPAGLAFDVGAEYEKFSQGAARLVEHVVAEVAEQARAAGCEIAASSVEGDARDGLNAHAADADLLVLGVQRAHGLRRVFLGSVAQAVVHHLTVPTVIVPGVGAG